MSKEIKEADVKKIKQLREKIVKEQQIVKK
jgi:hypothetical protein